MFVKAGALLPVLPYERAIAHGSASRQYEALELWLYPGADAGGASLYEDDGLSNDYLRDEGKGGFANTTIAYHYARDGGGRIARLTVTLSPTGGYDALPARRTLTVRLLEAVGLTVAEPVSIVVSVDGATVPGCTWARQTGSRYAGPSVALQLPPVPTLSHVTVAVEF